MKRASYAMVFGITVLALGAGGLLAFRRLEAEAEAARLANINLAPAVDQTTDTTPFVPIAQDSALYAALAGDDAKWRRIHARRYTLTELRARGNGTRSPREQMQDLVYEYRRSGQHGRAIAALEKWVDRNPRDHDSLLMLARMLNEYGRKDAAVERYRQLLAMKQGGFAE